MIKKILIGTIASIFSLPLIAQQNVFDITTFGAKGDGQTNNTIYIQQAIDKASSSGGGTVLFPSGKFVTGVINLKTGVTIKLELNSVLLGSAKRIDYGPSSKVSALIVAKDASNIGIIGKGTIDGQAPELIKDIYVMLNAGTLKDKEWQAKNPWGQIRPEERNRPNLIEFRNCKGVQIKDITIKDGLCWIQNYVECIDMIIDGITVKSTIFLNNDGIDLVDCKNAKVTNCNIDAADDGICLKSSNRNSSCENIYVADIRHAKGITFKNVQLNIKNPNYRVATIFGDVNGLNLNAIKIATQKAEPIIVLNNVKQFTKAALQLPVDEKKGIKILQ